MNIHSGDSLRIDHMWRWQIGMLLWMNRIDRNTPLAKSREIQKEYVVDGGYCIDAPTLLPAGACRACQVDEELWLAEQITVER